MSGRIIGTCGACGGPVTVPSPWLGTIPPTAECQLCHAVPDEQHGPTLKMRRPVTVQRATSGTGGVKP